MKSKMEKVVLKGIIFAAFLRAAIIVNVALIIIVALELVEPSITLLILSLLALDILTVTIFYFRLKARGKAESDCYEDTEWELQTDYDGTYYLLAKDSECNNKIK